MGLAPGETAAVFGGAALVFPIEPPPLSLGSAFFTSLDVICVGATVVAMLALHVLLYRTRVGTALRALASNPHLAVSRGIPGERMIGLIEEVRSVFPRDGIAACDVGSHKLAIGQFWRAYEPGTFLMANGLSGMGFGLPAAMAAQLVHPSRHVIAMVGDG